MKKSLIARNKNYRYLWIGQTGSMLGDWFNQVALAQTILFLSHSALSVGMLLMCRALPSVIIGPFAGPIVDRLPKKKTMVWTDLAHGIVVLSFIFAFLASLDLVCGIGLHWTSQHVFSPFPPSDDPDDRIQRRLGRSQRLLFGDEQYRQYLGSVLGGIVSAVFSPLVCFAVNGISYFCPRFTFFK